MSDSWKPIIRVLMYGLEYEDDLLTRAQRTFEVIARAPAAASAEPEDIREAIDQALSSSIDLSTLYEIAGKVVEQSYSDADLRKMLADLSRKLHQQFAKSGEPVPQAGIWAPATHDDGVGIAFAAGDVLPEHDGGTWLRFTNTDN